MNSLYFLGFVTGMSLTLLSIAFIYVLNDLTRKPKKWKITPVSKH